MLLKRKLWLQERKFAEWQRYASLSGCLLLRIPLKNASSSCTHKQTRLDDAGLQSCPETIQNELSERKKGRGTLFCCERRNLSLPVNSFSFRKRNKKLVGKSPPLNWNSFARWLSGFSRENSNICLLAEASHELFPSPVHFYKGMCESSVKVPRLCTVKK